MGRVTLTLAYTPPSLNRVLYQHWAQQRAAKVALQRDLGVLLMASPFPAGRAASVDASATIRFPTRRRRDEGNYRAVLEKALGDALVPRWLPDDTPDRYRFGVVTFTHGPPATIITLDWKEPQ